MKKTELMTFGCEHTLAICATLQYSYGQHSHNLLGIFSCNSDQLVVNKIILTHHACMLAATMYKAKQFCQASNLKYFI